MLMKDTTHNRLTGFGIYSLHTIFYVKIINIQLNKAIFRFWHLFITHHILCKNNQYTIK